LRIGQVAQASGLSPDSLRHYERIGLLPRPDRSSGGFREYPESTVERVKVVQRSLDIGFTLAELASIFRERAAGRAPCRRARALAAARLEALEAEITDLNRLRRALQRTLAAWDARLEGVDADRAAGLLESLAEHVDACHGDARPRPVRGVRRRRGRAAGSTT